MGTGTWDLVTWDLGRGDVGLWDIGMWRLGDWRAWVIGTGGRDKLFFCTQYAQYAGEFVSRPVADDCQCPWCGKFGLISVASLFYSDSSG